MSDFSRTRKGRKSTSRFAFGARLFCLTLITALGTSVVRAEEIAQANTLAPTASNAKDLAGAIGGFTPVTDPATPASVSLTQLAQAAPVKAAAADEESGLDLLSETNVTAQRRRTTERENTQTTYVVGKDRIKASGAVTVTDALKLVPGFNFADTLGGVVSDTSNYLRGLNSQRFVFLIDGAPQSRASNNRADTIGTLPVTNIDRIEVTTGGSTLRYGADAIAGVINVITALPEGPPKLTVGADFGSYGFSQYNLNYAGSNGLNPDKDPGYFAYQLGYQHKTAINDYLYTFTEQGIGGQYCDNDLPGGCFPTFNDDGTVKDPGDFKNGPFSETRKLKSAYVFDDFYYGKFIFKPGADHRITLSVNQENRRTGSGSNRLGCSQNPANYAGYGGGGVGNEAYTQCFGSNESRDTVGVGDNANDTTRIDAVWDWNLSELNTLQTQLSYYSAFLLFANPGSQKYITNRVLELSSRYTAELYPGNTLNTGLEFRSVRSTQTSQLGLTPFEDTATSGKLPSLDKDEYTWAVYIIEDIKLFDDAVILNFGSRMTTNLSFGTFTTSGVGLRYNFGSADPKKAPFALKFNVTQSFKSPSISDLYNGGPISGNYDPANAQFDDPTTANGNFQFKANPQLQPETGVGYDIGLDVQLSPSMLFRATYYRTDLQKAISDGSVYVGIQNIGAGYAYTYQTVNSQAFLSTGWEFTFNWDLDEHWSLSASHAIVDSRPLGTQEADLALTPFPFQSGYYYEYQSIDVPYNTTGLSLSYKSSAFNASLSGQIVGIRPVFFGPYYDSGFSRWDLTTSTPITPWLTINADIFNIFGENNALANSTRISGNGGVSSPGTTFRVGFEATF